MNEKCYKEQFMDLSTQFFGGMAKPTIKQNGTMIVLSFLSYSVTIINKFEDFKQAEEWLFYKGCVILNTIIEKMRAEANLVEKEKNNFYSKVEENKKKNEVFSNIVRSKAQSILASIPDGSITTEIMINEDFRDEIDLLLNSTKESDKAGLNSELFNETNHRQQPIDRSISFKKEKNKIKLDQSTSAEYKKGLYRNDLELFNGKFDFSNNNSELRLAKENIRERAVNANKISDSSKYSKNQNNINDFLLNDSDDNAIHIPQSKSAVLNIKERKTLNKYSKCENIGNGSFEIPDIKEFLNVYNSIPSNCEKYSNSIKYFCTKYNAIFPEYEIVRENDVFRCTALFCGIKFVSSYEYEKQAAKNDTNKKVMDFILMSWKSVFENDRIEKDKIESMFRNIS